MSRIPDKSLARTVYQISFSGVNGLPANHCIKSNHEMDNLHPGTDDVLRCHARSCLKENLGWIDSAGKLVREEYPKMRSLLERLLRRKQSAPGSQPLFSLQSSPTVPEAEVVAGLGNPKLNSDTRDKGAAASVSDKTGTATTATDTVSTKGDNGSSAITKDPSVFVSATLHDGTLVVPSLRLSEQMSIGVGKSFDDFLRIISQWWVQHDRNYEQRGMASLIYIYSEPLTDSFEVLTLCRKGRWFEQPTTRYKLYHTPGTTDCSYAKSETIHIRSYAWHQLHTWRKILVKACGRSLKNHVGIVDEAGTLRPSEQPTIHPAFYDFQTLATDARNLSSERREDTKISKARYTPVISKDDRQSKMVPQKTPKTSMHEQIANTMRLAGALYEVSIMLNEEISNASAEQEDDVSLRSTNSDMTKEANPVFETMKNGEIDIDAVQGAIANLKAQLQDRKDSAQVLARVCNRWKEELETRYPLMKRKSAPHNDVGNTVSERSESPNTLDPATKTHTLGRSDKRESSEKAKYTPPSLQSQPERDERSNRSGSLIARSHAIENESGQHKPPAKVRYMSHRSESTPNTTRDDPQEHTEWSPLKLRYMDANDIVPTTTPSDPKKDDQSNGLQGKLSDKRPGKQPRSRFSGINKGSRDEDDGFSIFAL
jgi:hypothetical protein